jgi:hypothetical protein
MIGIHRSIPEPCMFGSMFHSFVESAQNQPTESRGRKSLYPLKISFCAYMANDNENMHQKRIGPSGDLCLFVKLSNRQSIFVGC